MRLAMVSGRPCIVREDRALDIEAASKGVLEPRLELLSNLAMHDELRNIADSATAEQWMPFQAGDLGPVARPYKAIGVALNYRAHAAESGLAIPDEPSVFGKFASSVVGPSEPIVIPPGFNRIDYEAEVVVVMGATGKHIPASQAWSFVAGITAGQDISDRKEQWRKPINQFTLPKSYDTFSPIGPFLVTVDEFDDPDDIEVIGWVDDVEVQRGRTSDLIFSVPQLVAWLSQRVTLEAGDLIFTGTPAGVGVSRDPRLYLRDGMSLRTEVVGVGTMVNPIVTS